MNSMTKKESRGPLGSVRGSLNRLGALLRDTYSLGVQTLWTAPALVAIAIVPEAAQHVVEIKIGMFESNEAFRALEADPTRWTFAYAKVAGIVLAILAIARFWAVGSVRATLLIPPRDLLPLAFAAAFSFATAYPFEWARAQSLPNVLDWSLAAVSLLIQAGCVVYFAGALFGDRKMTLAHAFSRSAPSALMIVFALAAAFVPSQALHMLNHKIALGGPDPLVWAVMAFDSLWVGLMAGLLGSALFAGYSSGLTWRGWTPRDDRHERKRGGSHAGTAPDPA